MIGLMTSDASMLFIAFKQYGTLPRWTWFFLLRFLYVVVFFTYLFQRIDTIGTTFFRSPFHLLLVLVIYLLLGIGAYTYTYVVPTRLVEQRSYRLPTQLPIYVRYDILQYVQYWFTFTALFTIPTLYVATTA